MDDEFYKIVLTVAPIDDDSQHSVSYEETITDIIYSKFVIVDNIAMICVEKFTAPIQLNVIVSITNPDQSSMNIDMTGTLDECDTEKIRFMLFKELDNPYVIAHFVNKKLINISAPSKNKKLNNTSTPSRNRVVSDYKHKTTVSCPKITYSCKCGKVTDISMYNASKIYGMVCGKCHEPVLKIDG